MAVKFEGSRIGTQQAVARWLEGLRKKYSRRGYKIIKSSIIEVPGQPGKYKAVFHAVMQE